MQAIVHYHMDGSEFINLSSNISSEGIFIRNFSPPPVGTELRIKVRLPQEQSGVPVQLIGKVVRVTEGVGVEERGMGVEFTSVLSENQQAIRFFVEQVYQMESPAEKDLTKDEISGEFRYKPKPADVLALQSDSNATGGATASEPGLSIQQKIIWGALLLLVGILFGGGIVFLFFLAS